MTINNPETMPVKRTAGRPAGSRNRRTVFVESLFTKSTKDVKSIVATAIKRAIAGDADFAKLVLERISPVPKGRRVSFAWPVGLDAEGIGTAFDAVLAALGAGQVTVDEALQIANILKLKAEIMDTHEIQTQIAELRAAIEKLQAPR
jgi:hypothetical protein